MNRPPQRTPPDSKESTGEPAELERAAAALREQFLAGFRQIRTNSASHFRKEMAYWPTTKRLMRMDPKEKVYIVPDYAKDIRWMRDVFTRALDALGTEIARQRKMEKFVNDLRLMRSEIGWVEREASKLGPLLKKEYLLWIQTACDGQVVSRSWRAPGWLDKWPADLLPKDLLSATRSGRLDAHRTAKVLKALVERVKAPMEKAQRSALNSLRIRLATEKDAARQSVFAADAKPSANATTKTHSPIEDTKVVPEVARDSNPIIEPKINRGPKANMDFHHSVANVVHSYGLNWKQYLEQIVRKLGKSKIQPLAAWTKRKPPARSWDRAWQQYPSVVLKAIEYSLKMAAKDVTEKPSETLGNLR